MTTLRGTMLTPGVSKNMRLYTPEMIRKAHDRLVERINAGDFPVNMLTHHDAEDDSTRIVGQITSVTMNGDNLDYTAELATTDHAKTIEKLVTGDKPFLKNVSIRGYWLGPVVTTTVNGEQVITSNDLEIDGLDFTKNPGVVGATVAAAEALTAAAAETSGRVLITESATARVAFTETAPDAPPAKAVFGDPGYQADKIKRYPLTTLESARTSWARINGADVAETYTPAQASRIRSRVKRALKQFGADMTETAPAATALTEGAVRLSDVTECYDCYDAPGTAGFSISAYNGPLTVSVSAYSGIDPADLAGVAQAAMAAAVQAVHALDPDDDGDIDAGTSTTDEVDDDNMESAAPTPKEATVAETVAPEASTEETTHPEGESTTEETAPAAAPEIDYDKLAEAIAARQAKAAEAAPEATPATESKPEGDEAGTTETTPAATPIDEATIRESVRAEERAKVIKEALEAGLLSRKGRVVNATTETDENAKPLHEMTADELRAETARRVAPLFTAVER